MAKSAAERLQHKLFIYSNIFQVLRATPIKGGDAPNWSRILAEFEQDLVKMQERLKRLMPVIPGAQSMEFAEPAPTAPEGK